MTEEQIEKLKLWLSRQAYSSPPSAMMVCLDYEEMLIYLPMFLKDLLA